MFSGAFQKTLGLNRLALPILAAAPTALKAVISADMPGFLPFYSGNAHRHPSAQFPNRQNRQRVVLTSKTGTGHFLT
jgi:hypothetical protein